MIPRENNCFALNEKTELILALNLIIVLPKYHSERQNEIKIVEKRTFKAIKHDENMKIMHCS